MRHSFNYAYTKLAGFNYWMQHSRDDHSKYVHQSTLNSTVWLSHEKIIENEQTSKCHNLKQANVASWCCSTTRLIYINIYIYIYKYIYIWSRVRSARNKSGQLLSNRCFHIFFNFVQKVFNLTHYASFDLNESYLVYYGHILTYLA